MPVTAKLSRKFYDTFGDDIVSELVNWFNQVDGTYRSKFKLEGRVGELNAKLEQRIAELRAEVLPALQGTEVRLIRWMFLFWVGSLGTTIALIKL